MSFLRNLPKDFIRSGVRQFGRDGGKVISNAVYKGKHGTPIYNSGNPNRTATNGEIDLSEIDMSIQPEVKGGGISPIISGILILLIPIIGPFILLYKMIKALTMKSTHIYAKVANKVRDRRYKEGYRIDGYSIIKTNATRVLSKEEKASSRQRGLSYLASLVILILVMTTLVNNNDDASGETSSSEEATIGYLENVSLDIRDVPYSYLAFTGT